MVVTDGRNHGRVGQCERFGFVVAWKAGVGLLCLFVFVVSQKIHGAFFLVFVEFLAASEEYDEEDECDETNKTSDNTT